MSEKTQLNFKGSEIDSILASVDSHVSSVFEQNFNENQKRQARENINAQVKVKALKTEPQTLTDSEKDNVRDQIQAASVQEVSDLAATINNFHMGLNNKVDFSQSQEFSIDQKKRARENLGLKIQDKTDKMILPVGRDSDGQLWTYDLSKPLNPDSWENIGEIIRRGLAPNYWEPGDQINVDRTIDGVTTTLTFDVLGFDYDTPVNTNINHTMSVALHDLVTAPTNFSSPCPTFYLDDGLPPGTYSTKINNASYTFTLVNGWAPSTQVVFTSYNPVIFTGYLKGTNTISEIAYGNTGTDGIFLGETRNDLITANEINIEGIIYPIKINCYARIQSGTNVWANSYARAYFNSNSEGAAAGQIASWYNIQDDLIRPINSTDPGFLYGFEPGFVNLITEVKKRTRVPNDGEHSGSYMDTNERLFFLTQTEINLPPDNQIFENSFGTDRTFTNILTTPYPMYVGVTTNNDRIKYSYNTYHQPTARYWYLRSPDPWASSFIDCITDRGRLDFYAPSHPYFYIALSLGA